MLDRTRKGGGRLWALPGAAVDRPPAQKSAPAPSRHANQSSALHSTPVAKSKGAWLATVRSLSGARSAHSIDVERRPFDLTEARARGGEAVLKLLEHARGAASDRQKEQLASGQLSWAAFYRLAAKGIFGSDHTSKIRYAAVESRMRSLGLGHELDAMLGALPRPLLVKLRSEGAVPLELFTAQSIAIGSWTKSPHPMSREELSAELAHDGRSAELAAVPTSPQLTGVEIARLLEARRREDVDVLVIGAGAAGIGAANQLLDRGRSVTVLEAKNRDGGRAFTDEGLGLPFDHGCAWIHESTENPFLPLVEALGFATVATEKFQKVFAGGDPIADAAQLRGRMEAMAERWSQVAKRRPDARPSMVSAPQHPLDRMAAEVLGPLELALELDQFSVGEVEGIVQEKDDRLVQGGLGNVVHAFSHGLPIELESPVTTVRWSKEGVEVESNGRTFRAKKILLTVSPDVLQKRIVFDPPLPAWKTDAFDEMQMASFEKIALQFAPGTLDHVQAFERACGFDSEGRPFELLIKPWSKDVAVVMVGGDFAKELLAAPESEAVAYAKSVFESHYGAGTVVKAERTEWTNDPDIGGTWAVGKVGGKDADRTAYAAPVENTVFISGEACGGRWAASVNGAFFNGHDTGEQISSALGADSASVAV